MAGKPGGSGSAEPHGRGARCWSAGCAPRAALRRAFALLLLCTFAAPVSHAAFTSTSTRIRVAVADVGAHSFSASLRATASVRQVAYVVWQTAACGGTPNRSVVWAQTDCNGVALDASQAGQVDLKTRWNTVEVRAGPGLLSQTNYTLFLADLADASNVVIGVSVMTLDDTPPTYTPGTPRVLSVGERGVAFAVGLSEPGLLRYVLQSSVASPPSLSDVLSGAGTLQLALPVGGTQVTEYVLDGVAGDSAYALYLAASDLATPTPNTKARLEVMLFTTPLCDPCPAGRSRLPLAADCACAVGSPFQVVVGVLPADFDAHLFVRALAAYLGRLPSQVLVTSVTTFGDPAVVGDEYLSGNQVLLTNLTNVTVHSDKTLVAFELLPLQPPWFYDWEIRNLTSAVVNSTLVPSDQQSPWPAVFGGVTLISGPWLPGPPTTYIDESSLPLGRVFPRYQAANPLLDFDGWVRPSVPAESTGTQPNARIVFGATLGGGAVRGPCATCKFLCRLDVAGWEPCTSPYVVEGLTIGEHLFQVRASANDTADPLAAFYTWALDFGPWVGFVVRPPAAVNTSALNFAFASASGCALSYTLDGTTWTPIADVGNMSTPALFTLPNTTAEGMNTLTVACNSVNKSAVTAKCSWRLDTVAPAVALPGELVSGAVIHRDTAAWLTVVNDTDAVFGPGSGVADVQCRLVDSTNATSPPPLFDWAPCPTALQGSVNATGLLTLASGIYAMQIVATDHAGNACDIVVAEFKIDTSLPLTPAATVVDLVVTLTPEASSSSTTAFYEVLNVLNGVVLLKNGTRFAGGAFVAKADGAAGLTFVPTSTFFTGDRRGSMFGFDVQAADASQRLGGDVLRVNLTVPRINSAPVVDASRPLFLRDAYNTGAALHNTALGELVADVLATGNVFDADGDPIGLAVISAATELGVWEASADGGTTWFALLAASASWPLLVGGGASDRLRFSPRLDHPSVLSTTDWAAAASLAFYAWDGTDGSVAGATCKNVSVYSPEAEAASSLNISLLILVQELQGAANGSTVCIPFRTNFTPAGPFSEDAGVAVISVFDVVSVRVTDAEASAARSAASAFAVAVAGCPPSTRKPKPKPKPKHPSGVDLPVSQMGAALMLTGAAAPLPDLVPPWTVEAWVRKRARLASTIFMASSSYPNANSTALLLECSGARYTIGVRRVGGWPSGAADLSFGVEAPLDTWTHLAFVDDGQALTLIVNGTLAASLPGVGGLVLPSGSVGYNLSVSAFTVDELRVWRVARSAQQVAAAVQAQLPPTSGSIAAQTDGLLYSLRFEEGCGANASDTANATATASLNATATLVGGASFVRGVSLACVEVTGVLPEEGPPAGGSVITLLGNGFPTNASADAACVFSNGLYSRATSVNDTSVTCVVPPAVGDGAIRVSYADPGLGSFAADGVLYAYASAFVAGIHPTQGPVTGGTLVTVFGSGFHAAPGMAVCRFTCLLAGAGAPAAEAWLVSASLLQCESPTQPNASACLVDVSLNGGTDWVPHPQLFTFVSTLLSATPLPRPNGTFTAHRGSSELLQTGPTTGGGVLRLLLPPLDFGPLSRATLPACGIGTLRPLAARLAGANSIECVSPARVRGASAVTVSVNGRDWEALAGGFGPRRFVVHSQPSAVAVLPEEAPAVGGALLTVFGSGGAAAWDLTCAFGSSSADGMARADARSAHGLGVQVEQGVQCVSPSVLPGFVAIRISGDGVTGPSGNDGVLQFLAREAPLTTGAFPRVLDANGGTLLAVTGSNFAPSMQCVFANGSTAAVHFVSTALVQCEAPPGAPGLNTVAVLPALRGAHADDQDLGAVRVAYAAGVADPAALADGVPLGILCAFRTVRVAADAGQDGAVECRLPAGFVESASAGLGNNWQDVGFGSSDDNSSAVNTTDGFADLASLRGRLDDLAIVPGAGSATGSTLLSVFAAVSAQFSSALLFCHFLEGGRVSVALAGTGSSDTQCTVPPALSSLGGFAVVRLVMAAGDATINLAETQFMYSPAARVTNVALPRVTALATDGRGRVLPGRLLWSGRPVAVAGVHFAGATSIVCRFGSEVRPAGWVSTALVRCELTDTAAVDAPAPVAVGDNAADDWSAAASCAMFSWLR